MSFPNKFDGPCSACGVHVHPGEGAYAWRQLYCRFHDPDGAGSTSRKHTINVSAHGAGAALKPAGFLGSDGFASWRAATNACKNVKGADGQWTTTSTLDALPGVLEALRKAGFQLQVAPTLAATLQARAAQTATQRELAGARAQAVDAALQARGLALFPFQGTGIDWLTQRDGALLADEMGLGKTIQALVAAPAGAPVLVVCPAVAKGVWEREAARWRPDLRVVVLEGRGSFRWPTAGELVVINYDILGGTVPPCLDGTVLIADEAHALKNSKAKRTDRFRALSEIVRAFGGKVWLLTATPLLGKPQELWSVLQAAGVANEVFGSWKRFVALFDGEPGEWGGFIWGTPSPEVPALLKRAMLRREKAEVLKDLPAKRRQDYVVELTPADVRRLDRLVVEICQRLGTTPEGLAHVLRDGVPMFEEMSRARTLLAGAKIPALLALVESYEEQEEPLVVFSAHRAPIDILAGREGWAVITGDTKPEDRRRIEEAFQAGQLRGVAATIQAGGVAITLTRASNAVFCDLDWTPALNAQAEDRIHRIGTQRPVLITRLVAAHALDERVLEVLSEKQGIIGASTEAASRGAAEKVEVKQAKVGEDELVERQAEKARRFNEYAVASGMSAREFLDELREGARAMVAAEVLPARRGPQTAQERWAAAALATLTALDPDRAREENGVGWNKSDGGFGSTLARQATATGLTDRQWEQAVKLCRKYHRQVGECP